MDGRFYDVVIPNYYDTSQFPCVPGYDDRDDYLLYLARLDDRKGIRVACEVAKYAGMRLVTAGSGTPPDGVDHRGIVQPAQRSALLAGARALIQPTMFLEPFGGSVVEAMLSGLPVITTDWGAFTETVRDGRDGYRCRTLKEFVNAAHTIDELMETEESRRVRAIRKWGMDFVGPQYDRWFKRLDTIYDKGWYTL
jgi:glycosyltransferase involved in cell wall biosynthesis